MNIAIEVPEDIAQHLDASGVDLPQRVREAVALEAYRSGEITEAEVQRLLQLPSRWETDRFLRRARAYLDYTEADLERDVQAIRGVMRE